MYKDIIVVSHTIQNKEAYGPNLRREGSSAPPHLFTTCKYILPHVRLYPLGPLSFCLLHNFLYNALRFIFFRLHLYPYGQTHGLDFPPTHQYTGSVQCKSPLHLLVKYIYWIKCKTTPRSCTKSIIDTIGFGWAFVPPQNQNPESAVGPDQQKLIALALATPINNQLTS